LPDGLFSNRKSPFLVKFGGPWNGKYFMTIWNILWPLGIFYRQLVILESFWNIFPRFGTLYQEKSGNLAAKAIQFV
jgi:hypothetical protein